MEKPRVVGIKDFVLEEREPPGEKNFVFLEKWEPQESIGDSKQASFIDRLKAMLGVK